MPEDNNGNPIPEDQNQDSAQGDSNIPEWMRDAGWQEDSGTFDESKPIFDDLESDDDEIVPADIPAWLEDAAPDGFSVDPNATPAFEGIDTESFITTGDLMPSSLPDNPPPPLNQVEKDEHVPEPEPEPDLTPEPEPVEPEAEKTPSDPGIDIPSWLKNLEMDEDSQETAVAWLENMPESLRATEEEKAAALASTQEPESLEPAVDELAWMDELTSEEEDLSQPESGDQAELSESLVASELIPEQREGQSLFAEEEIKSVENDVPDWLKELDKVSGDPAPAAAPQEISVSEDAAPQEGTEGVPDWMSESAEAPPAEVPPAPTQETPAADDELPDWLGDFDPSAPDPTQEEESELDWLDSLSGAQQAEQPQEELAAPETPPAQPSFETPSLDGVSPNDETLNTQVPDWLSKIGENESGQAIPESPSAVEPETSWVEEIGEPGEEEVEDAVPDSDGDVLDWLEQMGDSDSGEPDTSTSESTPVSEQPDQEPVELETAKYFQEDEPSDSLPDWLSELASEEDEQPESLESAIRQSDHPLTEEEVDFLERADEVNGDNAEWLSKLDAGETAPDQDLSPAETEIPAAETAEPQPAYADDDPELGGMLERLQESEEVPQDDVPQWLEDLKKEEDPQETAVLWLKQFVEQGNSANVHAEIKRYTDELNPGDSIPKWMEDLKNEEDPQTTAMLWLEKLAGEQPSSAPKKPPKEDNEASWLDELEREEAGQEAESTQTVKDFEATGNDWLADLEIDEKLKSDDAEIPDWTSSEKEPAEAGEETPPWMKATSPLEGDFHTDELAGSAEKEVEIPEWLAGYGEGEAPEPESEPEIEPVQTAEEQTEGDEYTWVSASDATKPVHEPIDLNKAAISQLEAILGISYQVAQGIVQYREKNGPFTALSDLLNVPEITDAQTIEILKPEVIIQVEEPEPEPTPSPEKKPETAKPAVPSEGQLQLAQAAMAERKIPEALEFYTYLIKKKKNLDQVIADLQQAAVDHPVDISILKTLGEAYMRADKLDEALEAYSRAEDLLT